MTAAEMRYLEKVRADRDDDMYVVIEIEDSSIAIYFSDVKYCPGTPARLHPPELSHPEEPDEVEFEYCTGSWELDEWIDANYAEEMYNGVMDWVLSDNEERYE